ncbi:MAG: hypothetical protein RLZZ196_2805 [Bacteroidota bacterium]|jgi:hypothetical protein
MERSLKDRYLLMSALGIGWTETSTIPDEEFTYLMNRAIIVRDYVEDNSMNKPNNK